jgi:hypothetical protein
MQEFKNTYLAANEVAIPSYLPYPYFEYIFSQFSKHPAPNGMRSPSPARATPRARTMTCDFKQRMARLAAVTCPTQLNRIPARRPRRTGLLLLLKSGCRCPGPANGQSAITPPDESQPIFEQHPKKEKSSG